jgi:arginyl-tRNA synthetase
MQTVQQQIQNHVQAALQSTLSEQFSGADISAVSADSLQVVPTGNPQFGDYQWNGALPLAKALKTNPRALAQAVVEKLEVSSFSAPPEIAGPGFINFRLQPEFLASMIAQVVQDERAGIPTTETPRTVIVDYPSPNVAKPLHVGHIRTTFIGDAIARLLRFVGHNVVGDNHIGDWGTPIGMVIWGWKRFRDEAAFDAAPLEEMGRIYKRVKELTDKDKQPAEEAKATLDAARAETAKLQSGDEENLAIWNLLRERSQIELDAMYQRLDIRIDETLGESFYNDRLAPVVQELRDKGLAVDSQGAVIIPFEEPEHLRDKPMLIQKSDGGYLYATTDLATIQYRMERWQPDEMIYIVDARQSDHFRQLFAAAALWGYDKVLLEHVGFGKILGDDGKPIKTREGDPPRLSDLLDEAERRALEIVREKNPDLPHAAQQEVARVVGIGAIKYADLSQNRTGDYTFSWEKMLALQGNSAPYLLFAYVRIRSIFRRAGLDEAQVLQLAIHSTLVLEHDAELALAKYLLRFHLAIETALLDYRLNAISDYLFELSQKFSSFIEACRVLDSEEPARSSRLVLCLLTANVLKTGLNLLGIGTIEQM